MIPQPVLHAYNFDDSCTIRPHGSGHIHKTFKIAQQDKNFILQRINTYVFKNPERITHNILAASGHLKKIHPDYRFLSILKTKDGDDNYHDAEGYPWRLYPFIENTFTINEIQTRSEAFEAAKGFGRFSKNLSGCDPNTFMNTIDRFHDLGWRYEQFEMALKNATPERLQQANDSIALSKRFAFLVDQYQQLISSGDLKLRITHNDTKINNILFDNATQKAVCVIDLDTLMPGYFIYDLGDMVRTFVSPSSEAESDFAKILFRKEIYDALVDGYLSEMSGELSTAEKAAIPFSGMMITYMIGLRFLTDFLNGDVYFATSYEGENLDRAKNQLKLLEILKENV